MKHAFSDPLALFLERGVVLDGLDCTMVSDGSITRFCKSGLSAI